MKKLLSLLMCIMMVCVFVGGENVPSVLTASASTTVGTVKVKTEYNCTTDAIRIKWNKVSGASGYQVYRWNGKGWTVLKTIRDVNTLNYRDGSRSSGTLYKYKVKAFKKVNGTTVWGKASDTKYAVTRPKGVTIVASSKSSSAVRLRWTKQTCDGYQILKLKNGSWVKVTTIKNKDTNAYRIAGLASSTKYTFKVRPYKSDTKGGYMFGAADTITITTNASPTPVGANGQLRVSGANIVNKNGDKFQIKGMSTHGIMWENSSDILSKESLKVLRDDWKVNTIRIAMYTEEWGGYTTGSDFAAQAKKKVATGVENAKSLGMYAIIDWHILNDGNPQTHQSEAVAFFTEMAKKYKDYNNVMYEICNEPNGGVTWNGQIKSYCQAVVSAIRKYDKDAIIICGTGTWSQDIDQVVGNKLSDKNCVYALHFYANTHTDWLRNRFTDCYNKGLPILVSEFGTCDASGNGGFNSYQTKAWLDLLNSKKVGYINWSAGNKAETASAFLPGTNLAEIKAGTSQLTESGKLIRELYRK